MHMAKITLYGAAMGSSFRAHWMLAELGLEYETKPIDIPKGENRTPEYLALNPAGLIPTMVHDGFVLTESTAIVHYLAEKYDPKFFGPMTPESHAELLRWEIFTLLYVDKNFLTLCYKKFGRPVSPENEEAAMGALKKYLPIFEAHLAGKEYVTGPDFSVADIVIRTSFMYGEFVEYDFTPYPAIAAWLKRCAGRPAFIKARQA